MFYWLFSSITRPFLATPNFSFWLRLCDRLIGLSPRDRTINQYSIVKSAHDVRVKYSRFIVN